MNRQEAKDALRAGHTLTHIYFSPEETVKENDSGKLEFEDGCICSHAEFWTCRSFPAFDVGWSIYGKA